MQDSTADRPGPPATPIVQLTIALSLVVGIQLWLIFAGGLWGPRWAVPGAVAAAAVTFIPRVGRHWMGFVDKCASPSAGQIRLITAAVAVATFAYLLSAALVQKRSLEPQWHDEHAYIIQARHIAAGRLWLPAHAEPEFFESFLLLATPVYAVVYFPGTALVYGAGLDIGIPPWVISLLITAAAAAVLYRLVLEFAGGFIALLSPVLFIAVDEIRILSIKVLSHPLMMLLGPLIVLLYLRWRREPTVRRAATIGLVIGFALIVRPFDTIAFTIPVALAMAFDLRRAKRSAIVATAGVMALCMLPFLSLQLVQNFGITGSVLRTARSIDMPRDIPQFEPSFAPYDPFVRPTSDRPQAQDLYDQLIAPAKRVYTLCHALTGALVDRLRLLFAPPGFSNTLPTGPLIVLLPAGVIAAARSRAWLLAAVLPAFLALYLPLALFMPHYGVVMACPMLLLVLLGIHAITNAWPSRRAPLYAGFAAMALISGLGALPGINREVSDKFFELGELAEFRRAVDALPHRPALVFVRYQPGDEPQAEPVYNITTRDVDDAQAVIAHDRGPDDMRLIRYYARIEQDRAVYRYVRRTGEMTFLGTTRNLAAAGL